MLRPILVGGLALALFAGLGGPIGCSDDPGDPPVDVTDPGDGDPPLHDGEDEILFRVYVEDASGNESLRWVGDATGPALESPEPTERPWVPYGRGFRVAWEPDARSAPVVATRFRFYRSALEDFFLPYAGPDSVAFDETFDYRFANDTPVGALDPAACGSGPTCFGQRRLDSGTHYLEVWSVNANGRVISSGQTLPVEVNYAPSVRRVDRPADPDSTFAFPAWTLALQGQGRLERALTPGDTVPSGARVRVLLRGTDRFETTVADPDSFCCDVQIDGEAPGSRYKGYTRYALRERDSGSRVPRNTFVGPTSVDSVLVLTVGPAEYEVVTFAVVERGRQSEPDTLRFVAGFPPRAPSLHPSQGTEIVLLPPEQIPPTGDDGAPSYTVIPNQNRTFDTRFGTWALNPEAVPIEDRRTEFGALYRIPLRLEARADPRVAQVDRFILGQTTDLPRSFAYEMLTEFDPLDRFDQGIGDRADGFLDGDAVDADGRGWLDLAGSGAFEGIEIFLPNTVFSAPWLLFPDIDENPPGTGSEVDLAVGERVKADLGRYTFIGRASTTVTGSSFVQSPPAAVGLDTRNADDVIEAFGRYGRVGPSTTVEFAVRLRVVPATGADPVIYPPPAP